MASEATTVEPRVWLSRRWTPSDERLLKDYYETGRSIDWIAAELGRGKAAVQFRINKLGIHRGGKKAPKLHGPKGGLATRMALIQGLHPEPEAHQGILPEETLKTFIADPEAFFSWLGMTLFDYQKGALGQIRQEGRICLVWGRQTGKDTLTALYGLYTAIVRPSSIVVCVSPSQRQSDLWMQTLKFFATLKKELRDSITDSSQSEMAFSNKSMVYSLPSGTQGSATIRGFSKVTLLVVNEAAWVSEETFQAIQPFLAVSGKGAKLVLISTPFGQSGYLWRAWNNELFSKSHAPSSKSPLVDSDFLRKERKTMDVLSYEAEYEARFLSSQNAYFSTELLADRTEAYMLVEAPLAEHEGLKFYLGCDWARIEGADRTVLTVVGVNAEDSGKVLWIRLFEGVDYVTQANYVQWLHGLWGFQKIYSDASNHAVNDLLVSRMLPVEPIQFSMPSKIELFGRLKATLEAKRLILPNHPDMMRELSTFEYRISEHGNLLLHHATGGHDDYVDSLALAARDLTVPQAAAKITMLTADW